MANSLRETRNNAQKRADEFKLQWKHPACKDKVLVLVEGKNDYNFYFKFFRNDTTVVADCDNCGKVIEVFRLLNETDIIHIAIKDSDFDRLNGKTFPLGFFLSDAHDYEMMCLANPQTENELFCNLAIPYDRTLINKTFDDLRFLSYFKWYNYKYQCKYNFRKIPIGEATRGQLKDYTYIQSTVVPMSPSHIPIDETALNLFIIEENSCDPYELTVGHDFIQRFCHHLKQMYSQHTNTNEDKIRTILHPCFRMSEFVTTALYHHIRDWEIYSGKAILKNG